MPESTAIVPAGDWLRVLVMSIASIGWSAIKNLARSFVENSPASICDAAKNNDVARLKDLLTRLPQQVEGPTTFRTKYLEHEDLVTGWTALMAAAAQGYNKCVHELLMASAWAGHADRWGRTALHLACQNSHVTTVQMLLQAAADPFMEDCKGYTALDFALNLDATVPEAVNIVRMIEQRARFSGWLCMKVVKFAGFRRVWEKRWCIISPRRHNRRMYPDDATTYQLLTWFRSPNEFTVLGKVWLNGADVKLEERNSLQECTLTLQRNHEKPSDAFVVSDTHGRHSISLRGVDDSAGATADLRSAVSVMAGPGGLPPVPPSGALPLPAPSRTSSSSAAGQAVGGRSVSRPQPVAASTAAHVPRLPAAAEPGEASMPHHARGPSLADDEAFARRLQDEEWAAANSAPQQEAPSGAPQGPLAAGAGGLAAPERADSAASSEPGLYPDIQAYAPPSAPPMTAPQQPPQQGGRQTREEDLCVICQENLATAGFLHGTSMHKCACKECAQMYQQPGAPKDCPMCRQRIQQVIFVY